MLSKILDAIKWILSAATLAIAHFSGRWAEKFRRTKMENKKLKQHAAISAKPRASITDIRDWLRKDKR